MIGMMLMCLTKNAANHVVVAFTIAASKLHVDVTFIREIINNRPAGGTGHVPDSKHSKLCRSGRISDMVPLNGLSDAIIVINQEAKDSMSKVRCCQRCVIISCNPRVRPLRSGIK